MKEKISKETGSIIAKNIQKNVHGIAERAVIEEKSKIYSDEQSVKNLSRFVYLIGIVGPVLAVFQALKIFVGQTAAGVSVFYWVAYLAVAAGWFGYGFYYKNKAIMVVYGLWVFVEIIILNGIYFYG